MKQSEFRRQLTASTPDMPEYFVRRVDRVLEGIAAQDENAPTCMGRSIRKRTIVIIVALIILLMSLTASALMQWKSFEQLSDIVGDNEKAADPCAGRPARQDGHSCGDGRCPIVFHSGAVRGDFAGMAADL